MKRLKCIFLLPILLLYFSCSPVQHKDVFIIIDGVPADVVEQTPNLVIEKIAPQASAFLISKIMFSNGTRSIIKNGSDISWVY